MTLNPESEPKTGASSSLVGQRLGDYQVLRKLGRGGMADVYAARHLTLGRDVAIKVLRREFARDQDYVERFRREARAAARLNHPCIVQVYDVGSVGPLHYIAQELIDGENLREYLAKVGTISAEEAVAVLLGVGSALEAAAEMGITHRDIKPENVMRSSKGLMKVADFGLARVGQDAAATGGDLTQVGLTLGTPRYMSPEQVQGHPVDVRSDLYSLGVTLYHLLAGRPPFEADDPLALAVLHLHETPKPLARVRGSDDLPEWLIAVVAKLMQKSPVDRFQSPTQLLEAVRSETGTAGTQPFPGIGAVAATTKLQRVSEEQYRLQRRFWWRGLAAAAVVLLLTTLSVAAGLRTRPPSIEDMLVPDDVPKAANVREQYWIALTRDDLAGWRSVGDYFPPQDSNTNAEYYQKSLLQLAQWYARQQKWFEAEQTLNRLLSQETLRPLFHALAWVRMCEIAEGRGNEPAEQRARESLRQAYQGLKSGNQLEIFNDLVSEAEQLKWGLNTGGIAPRES